MISVRVIDVKQNPMLMKKIDDEVENYRSGKRRGLYMEEKKKIIYMFIGEIQKRLGGLINKIILYGSYAREDYRENSDIDILILTSLSESEIKKIENEVYDIAYDYGLEFNVLISVNIKNEEHFNYWLGALPYYDNIKREGIILAR
ncbi:MAG: nucleotidyltransferase domain-containing protein [Clostridium sp.]|nr:nucleotidyltransferase domain-containing protein [Clostridium sp.]